MAMYVKAIVHALYGLSSANNIMTKLQLMRLFPLGLLKNAHI